jgi:hypothetical protein
MSEAEKRSVHTDALATLGTIIDETAGRDAIHLAVHPVKAQVRLYPGENVGVDGSKNDPVGIVDPFLRGCVEPGEMFWLVIYPRKITSLRHVWQHPAFPDEGERETAERVTRKLTGYSEEWLRNFASTNDVPSYDQMMEALADSTKSPCFGNDGNAKIPAEFWDHYETVTGKTVPQSERGGGFRCAC